MGVNLIQISVQDWRMDYIIPDIIKENRKNRKDIEDKYLVYNKYIGDKPSWWI